METIRRSGATSAAVLSGLAVTLGVTLAVSPESAVRVGLDVWNLRQAASSLQESREEAARLGAAAEELRVSIEATDHHTTRLKDGQLTLKNATALVEPLMNERAGFGLAADLSFPAPTHRLRVARYLIERVRRSMEGEPGRWLEVETRLEAQYREMR
jgi:hypothetical protein